MLSKHSWIALTQGPNLSPMSYFPAGENMGQVPDNSQDVVVITWVLCSVNDTAKVLQEVLRVLVPVS